MGKRWVAKHPLDNPMALRPLVEAFPKLKTITDATRPLTLVVRREHVSQAVPKDPAKCAFAIACRGLVGSSGGYVGRTVMYLISKDGTHAERYRVTPRAYAEIRAFDIAGFFQPATYTFHPWPKSQRLGSQGAAHRRTADQKAAAVLQKRPIHEFAGAQAAERGQNAPYVRIWGMAPVAA